MTRKNWRTWRTWQFLVKSRGVKNHGMTWESQWQMKIPFTSMGIRMDPKMEVLYHFSKHILWGDSHRPYIIYIGLIYGRYLQSRFLKWPLIMWMTFQHFVNGHSHRGTCYWGIGGMTSTMLWGYHGMGKSPRRRKANLYHLSLIIIVGVPHWGGVYMFVRGYGDVG